MSVILPEGPSTPFKCSFGRRVVSTLSAINSDGDLARGQNYAFRLGDRTAVFMDATPDGWTIFS
jgi:hypothetical protein